MKTLSDYKMRIAHCNCSAGSLQTGDFHRFSVQCVRASLSSHVMQESELQKYFPVRKAPLPVPEIPFWGSQYFSYPWVPSPVLDLSLQESNQILKVMGEQVHEVESSKKKPCELCELPLALTRHHVIPRSVHAWYLAVYPKGKSVNTIIMICRQCHDVIHRLYDHCTLAIYYSSVPELLTSGRVQEYLSARTPGRKFAVAPFPERKYTPPNQTSQTVVDFLLGKQELREPGKGPIRFWPSSCCESMTSRPSRELSEKAKHTYFLDCLQSRTSIVQLLRLHFDVRQFCPQEHCNHNGNDCACMIRACGRTNRTKGLIFEIRQGSYQMKMSHAFAFMESEFLCTSLAVSMDERIFSIERERDYRTQIAGRGSLYYPDHCWTRSIGLRMCSSPEFSAILEDVDHRYLESVSMLRLSRAFLRQYVWQVTPPPTLAVACLRRLSRFFFVQTNQQNSLFYLLCGLRLPMRALQLMGFKCFLDDEIPLSERRIEASLKAQDFLLEEYPPQIMRIVEGAWVLDRDFELETRIQQQLKFIDKALLKYQLAFQQLGLQIERLFESSRAIMLFRRFLPEFVLMI